MRKMKKILLGCTIGCFSFFALLFLAILGVIWYGTEEVKPLVEQTLKKWNQEQFREIYEKTTLRLQKRWSYERFRSYLEKRRKAWGKFIEADMAGQVSYRSDEKETRVQLVLPLKFERGKTKGLFRFVKRQDEWLLDEIHIPLPPLKKALKNTQRSPQNKSFDLFLLESKARQCLSMYNNGAFSLLYENLSKEQKSSFWDKLGNHLIRLYQTAGRIEAAG